VVSAAGKFNEPKLWSEISLSTVSQFAFVLSPYDSQVEGPNIFAALTVPLKGTSGSVRVEIVAFGFSFGKCRPLTFGEL